MERESKTKVAKEAVKKVKLKQTALSQYSDIKTRKPKQIAVSLHAKYRVNSIK